MPWRAPLPGTGMPEASGAFAPPLSPFRFRCSILWLSFLSRRTAGLPYLNTSVFFPRSRWRGRHSGAYSASRCARSRAFSLFLSYCSFPPGFSRASAPPRATVCGGRLSRLPPPVPCAVNGAGARGCLRLRSHFILQHYGLYPYSGYLPPCGATHGFRCCTLSAGTSPSWFRRCCSAAPAANACRFTLRSQRLRRGRFLTARRAFTRSRSIRSSRRRALRSMLFSRCCLSGA